MVKIYKPKFEKVLPLKKKEGNNMPSALNKKENEEIQDNLTIFHKMVLNPTKRQEMFDYYDKTYKETEEDNKFFKTMKSRRRLEK